MKTNLLDFNKEQLSEYLSQYSVASFRSNQIYEWLMKGVASFDEMSNIPAKLRNDLSENAVTGVLEIVNCLQSQIDETCKYLFRLNDGYVIESVLMKYKYGYSVCVSSQAGCRMGCTFCASAGIPFSRSLSAGEILGQIITIQRHKQIRVGHFVIMGIGEPMDNYDNVIAFLRRAQAPDGLGISFRNMSLSTCGVVPGILKLAEENIPLTLSVSLHNPFDDERSRLMPINRKYSLDKLMDACHSYMNRTGRRITFEYAMIEGVSDTPSHASALCGLIKGMLCHVNLIPVNEVSGNGYKRSAAQNIKRFSDYLEKNGISVTVRRELGRDIKAACGQLRKQEIGHTDT